MLDKNYFKSIFILLFIFYRCIKCDNCITYDFEADFYNYFTNDSLLCTGLPRWSIGSYNSLDIESPSSNSETFIQPNEMISCVSSFLFEMEPTGVIEVYVYIDSKSNRDQLVILAHQYGENGNDLVVGTGYLTPLNVNFQNGWQILRISLFGVTTFSGYLSFLGSAAESSSIIVDSFRYIPPLIDEASCEIYDDITIRPPAIEEPECISFNFEQEFDTAFSRDKGLCNGLSSWTLNNYTSQNIDTPNPNSDQFITPSSIVSCVSSFPFLVQPGGVIEVNVYMKSNSEFNQLGVIANKVVSNGNDAVIGSAVLTPLDENYVDGWHTLRVILMGDESYEGYVSFLGVAAEDSVVLIDSFRYIPPTLTQTDCKIYEGIDFELPVPSGDECVTYNFESDFESSFKTSNQLCNGYASWHLGTYYSISMDSYNPKSNTFISPNETSSCITSFTFPMKPGGTVEVNLYMKSVSSLDYVIVLAKKVVSNGIDTVAGFELYYANNENFVEGWNALSVTVMDFKPFIGYITLIGSTAEDSIGLIDSFKYIPPGVEDCDIY